MARISEGNPMAWNDEEMARRRLERTQRMETNRARSFEEADAWDLSFWQARSPQERINALEELRADRHSLGHAGH